MNTDSFKSGINDAACRIENHMRETCGEAKIPDANPVDVSLFPPLSEAELQMLMALLSIRGRDTFTPEQNATMEALMKRYVANGGTDPRVTPPDPNTPSQPTAGSMELFSLDDLKFIYRKIKSLFTNK